MTQKRSILPIIFIFVQTVTANNCHGVHSISDEKGNEIVFPPEGFLGKGAYGNVYEGRVVNGVFAGMQLPERVAVKYVFSTFFCSKRHSVSCSHTHIEQTHSHRTNKVVRVARNAEGDVS